MVVAHHMENWQWFLIWLSPVIGAGIGAIIGYMAKGAGNQFQWRWFGAALAAGAVGGLMWWWCVADIKAIWHAWLLVAGMIFGMGIAYLVEKFPVKK